MDFLRFGGSSTLDGGIAWIEEVAKSLKREPKRLDFLEKALSLKGLDLYEHGMTTIEKDYEEIRMRLTDSKHRLKTQSEETTRIISNRLNQLGLITGHRDGLV